MRSPEDILLMSLFVRIFEIMQQNGWTWSRTGVVLTDIDGKGLGFHEANSTRQWMFMDENVFPGSSVRVYVDGVEVQRPAFFVDHLSPMVVFSSPPGGVVTADFTESAVRVIDAYPDEVTFKRNDVPIVSIEVTGTDPRPFAIGTAREFQRMFVAISLWSSSKRQASDLTYNIRRMIRHLNMLDMGEEPYLDENGDVNTSFEYNPSIIKRGKYLHYPSSRNLEPGVGEKEKFMSLITAEIEVSG